MKRREAVVAAVVEEVGIKSFGGCWLITDNTKGDQKRSDHPSCSGSCGDGRPYTGWINSTLLPVIPCHHLSLIDQKRKEKDFNVFLWPAWGEMEKASTDRPIKEEGIDQELHWEHFIILCWSIYISIRWSLSAMGQHIQATSSQWETEFLLQLAHILLCLPSFF